MTVFKRGLIVLLVLSPIIIAAIGNYLAPNHWWMIFPEIVLLLFLIVLATAKKQDRRPVTVKQLNKKTAKYLEKRFR
jgi:hypothetical protein